jgi:pimeloyl-ACP methyl ester carboxylesterase
MSAIYVDDALIHYEVLGRGRPVLLLHSWVGSWRYWIPSMQAISNRYRVYALDLWGFGDSAKTPKRYSIEEQVRLLAGFTAEMGLRDVSLIGHGLGGIIATYFAADHTHLTDRLVAISFPMGPSSIHDRLFSSSIDELCSWLFGRSPALAEAREDAAKANPLAIVELLAQFVQVNWRQLLLRTGVRSLWIHGGKDPVISPPPPELLQFLPERGQHQIFENAGHFLMLDEASKFNRLLADFLALPVDSEPSHVELKAEWKRRVR